jgi:hypothetical protein
MASRICCETPPCRDPLFCGKLAGEQSNAKPRSADLFLSPQQIVVFALDVPRSDAAFFRAA